MALNLFNGGYLPLEQRCQAENLYWAIWRSSRSLCSRWKMSPRTCKASTTPLADTYFCNFSLFQSIPGQLGHQAALSGDADSSAERAADAARGARRYHVRLRRQDRLSSSIAATSSGRCRCITFNGDPYYLGVFLVGAYQEILGDLHNLFGDTHAVHVSLDDRGNVVLDAVIKGDTVAKCSTTSSSTPRRWSASCATTWSGRPRGTDDYEESGRLLEFYEDGLQGYTYLEEPRDR